MHTSLILCAACVTQVTVASEGQKETNTAELELRMKRELEKCDVVYW